MSTNEPSRERQTTATTLEATAPEEATEYDAEEQSRSTTPSTVGARETVILNPDHPPRLDTFHFSLRGPFLYAIFVIFCNVAVPCVSSSGSGASGVIQRG
jgi:hypothetical protein